MSSKSLPLLVLCFTLSTPQALAFPSLHPEPGPNACLRCHGNEAPSAPAPGEKSPPLLPEQFSMSWLMHEVDSPQSPPYLKIPQPDRISRGQTYYDWPTHRMIEIYQDRCIDIFPGGNEFSCKFLSVEARTYLITYPLGAPVDARVGTPAAPKDCCLWSAAPFWAPRPDVLRGMRFQQVTKSTANLTDWWTYDIPLPGPFGYGTDQSQATPRAFWFPVIGGWVQQEFSNFSSQKPDEKVFELPALCQPVTLSLCP